MISLSNSTRGTVQLVQAAKDLLAKAVNNLEALEVSGPVWVIATRCMVVLFATLMLLLGLMDIALGFGDSDTGVVPPLAARIWSSIPSLALFAQLMWPYRTVRARAIRWAVGLCLVAMTLWFATDIPGDFSGYQSGRKSWEIIPVSIGVTTLFGANAAAFVAITRNRGSAPDLGQ